MKTTILILALTLACGSESDPTLYPPADPPPVVVEPPPPPPPPEEPPAPTTCPALYCTYDGTAILWDACQPHPSGLRCADCHSMHAPPMNPQPCNP